MQIIPSDLLEINAKSLIKNKHISDYLSIMMIVSHFHLHIINKKRNMMKKLIGVIFALTLSSMCFAVETGSFKTGTGQLVKIGDSLSELIERTAQSPNAVKTIEWKDGDQVVPAMSYDYEVNQMIYTVTVVHDKVLKIEWQDKS